MTDTAQIISELEGLSVHYIRPVRGPEEQARFMMDYAVDLKGYPIEALKNACARWRRSDATKFPTIGQLLPIVGACVSQGKSVDGPKLWSPLEDDEYECLSLRDKIRHHELSAYAAGEKIPPMWWGGRAVTLDEMPADRADSHRFWSARRDHHYAEAIRLKQILSRTIQEGAA